MNFNIEDLTEDEIDELMHSDDFDDELLEDEENIDELVEMIIEEYEEQLSELQHAGVKGMKWGVRKKVAAKVGTFVKERKAKKEAKINDYHEKNKGKKLYGMMYRSHKYSTKDPLERKRLAMMDTRQTKAGLASAGVKAAIGVSLVAARAATRPENIRKAKNLVQAMKGSPIRYVDGKTMTNVVSNGFKMIR